MASTKSSEYLRGLFLRRFLRRRAVSAWSQRGDPRTREDVPAIESVAHVFAVGVFIVLWLWGERLVRVVVGLRRWLRRRRAVPSAVREGLELTDGGLPPDGVLLLGRSLSFPDSKERLKRAKWGSPPEEKEANRADQREETYLVIFMASLIERSKSSAGSTNHCQVLTQLEKKNNRNIKSYASGTLHKKWN